MNAMKALLRDKRTQRRGLARRALKPSDCWAASPNCR